MMKDKELIRCNRLVSKIRRHRKVSLALAFSCKVLFFNVFL